MNDCQLHAELRLAQGRVEKTRAENGRLKALVATMRRTLRAGLAEALVQGHPLPETAKLLARKTGQEEERVLGAAADWVRMREDQSVGIVFHPTVEERDALHLLHVAVERMEKKRG